MTVRYRYRYAPYDVEVTPRAEHTGPAAMGAETSSTTISPIKVGVEALPGTVCADAVGTPTAATGTRRWSRLVGWLLIPVGVAVVALLAWLASVPEALIAAALVMVVAGAYAWRARMLGGMLPTKSPGSERAGSDTSVDRPSTLPAENEPVDDLVEIIIWADGSITGGVSSTRPRRPPAGGES